jgi:hypothetical protein
LEDLTSSSTVVLCIGDRLAVRRLRQLVPICCQNIALGVRSAEGRFERVSELIAEVGTSLCSCVRPEAESRRLRTLEGENAKLKKLLADAMLNNVALKDLLSKKF